MWKEPPSFNVCTATVVLDWFRGQIRRLAVRSFKIRQLTSLNGALPLSESKSWRRKYY